MKLLGRPTLPLPRHRATTAHLCSAYPFAAEIGLGGRGVYLGSNLLTGGGGFTFDPFEAYADGIVTNPNMLIAGEPGVGKSATAKTFIHRCVGVFGRRAQPVEPAPPVLVPRRREGRARELLGIEAKGRPLRRVAAHGQRARNSL